MALPVASQEPRVDQGWSPICRYESMPPSRTAQDALLPKEAVQALQHAVDVRRLHPGNEPLLAIAMRRCRDAVHAALAHAPLAIVLRAGCVEAGGERVFDCAPTTPPFGPLRRAGIGEIVLAVDLAPGELQQLVRQLARVGHDADPELAVRALRSDTALLSVQLRAHEPEPAAEAPTEAPADWSLLPVLPVIAPSVATRIARDLAGSLPGLAAHQMLDDLEAGAATEPPAACLAQLLARMLASRDFGSAGCLLAELAELEQNGRAPAELREHLRAHAAHTADDAWFRRELAHGTRDELMNLAALVMQLPDEVASRFARELDAIAHPLSGWLRDLLPG